MKLLKERRNMTVFRRPEDQSRTSVHDTLVSKQDLICHVVKEKVARSAFSMAEVIPFLAYLLFPSNRPPKQNIFITQ